jgi:hypothetical protein
MKPFFQTKFAAWLLTICSAVLLSACGGGSGTPAADVPPPAWGSAGLLVPAGQQSKTFDLGTCSRSYGYNYLTEQELPDTPIYSAKMVVSSDGSITFRGSMTEGGTSTDILSITASSLTYRDLEVDAENGKISSIQYFVARNIYTDEESDNSPFSYTSLSLAASTQSGVVSNDSSFYRSVRTVVNGTVTEYYYENFGNCDGAITLEALTPVYLLNEARIAKLFLQPVTLIDPEAFDDDQARILNRTLVWDNNWGGSCDVEGAESMFVLEGLAAAAPDCIRGDSTSLNLDTAELKLGARHSTTTGLPSTPTPITITLAKLLAITRGEGEYREAFYATTPDQQEAYFLELEINDSTDNSLPEFDVRLTRFNSLLYLYDYYD